MKQITITLPDIDAGKFVASLLEMNVTFTVTTTVARDPLVFAALETPREMPYTREEDMPRVAHAPEDPREKDPEFIERGLKGAVVGVPTYIRRDRSRHIQRLTPDGRTSMQVVEAKIAQFAGRKFTINEIKALSTYSGFQPDTLQNQLHILMARGRLVKIDRFTFREVPANLAVKGKRASPLPPASQEELPLTAAEASSSTASPEVFRNGEGWKEDQADTTLAHAEGWTG